MAAFKVNITKNGNAIKFQFTDSDHYLYGNGVVEVPVNSLSLVIDESDFVTFKKASTNDTFITFDPANSNLSDKAGVIEFYKTNMVGSTGGGSESGITSGEVQTMIDNSLEDYYTDDEVDAALSGKASVSDVTALENEVATKAEMSAVTAVASDVSTLSGQVATKVAITDFNAYSAATDSRLAEDEEVTAAALNDLQENKADTSAVTAVQQSLSGKQDTLVSGTNIKTINNESILGSGNITISGGGGQSLVYYTEDTSNESATIMVQNDDGLGNRSENRVFVDGGDIIIESYNETDDGEGNTGTIDTQVDINSLGLSIITSSDDGIDTNQTELEVQPMGAYINSEPIATEPYVDAAITGKVDTSAITTSITSGSTDAEIPTAKAVYDAIPTGGTSVTVDPTLDSGSNNPVANSAITTAIDAKANRTAAFGGYSFGTTDNVNSLQYRNVNNSNIGSAIYYPKINGKGIFTNNLIFAQNNYNFQLVETSAITTAITSGSTDVQIPTAKAVYDTLGGLKLVSLTQSEYDQLATKDNDTLYIISNVVS